MSGGVTTAAAGALRATAANNPMLTSRAHPTTVMRFRISRISSYGASTLHAAHQSDGATGGMDGNHWPTAAHRTGQAVRSGRAVGQWYIAADTAAEAAGVDV